MTATLDDAHRDDLLLTVIMPVYNERRTLEEIVAAVLAEPTRKELIVVDDGSTDDNRDALARIAKQTGVTVMLHKQNRGKGAAIRTGIEAANGDLILIQDADLEYDPADYRALVQPILDGRADVVYGSRYLIDDRDPARPRDRFVHYLGNRLLTFVSNLATGLNLTDMETCYKCFRREAIAPIHIRSRRFTVEPELTAKIARSPARIFEVPIRYRGRAFADGKKIGWRDALAALFAIARYRFAD
ncbi:MAG: glycosyltransferase family 2 protein [Planctomycetota bacterium]